MRIQANEDGFLNKPSNGDAECKNLSLENSSTITIVIE